MGLSRGGLHDGHRPVRGGIHAGVYLADITQATFDNTSHTWSAPERIVTLVAPNLSAGASAVVVAPGTSHQAIVTGEFGGSAFAILQLPSTSGSGTPNVADYAYVETIPAIPNPAGGSSAPLIPDSTHTR